MIPDETQALEFHQKAGSSAQIIAHCKLVARVALTLAREINEKSKANIVDEKIV